MAAIGDKGTLNGLEVAVVGTGPAAKVTVQATADGKLFSYVDVSTDGRPGTFLPAPVVPVSVPSAAAAQALQVAEEAHERLDALVAAGAAVVDPEAPKALQVAADAQAAAQAATDAAKTAQAAADAAADAAKAAHARLDDVAAAPPAVPVADPNAKKALDVAQVAADGVDAMKQLHTDDFDLLKSEIERLGKGLSQAQEELEKQRKWIEEFVTKSAQASAPAAAPVVAVPAPSAS